MGFCVQYSDSGSLEQVNVNSVVGHFLIQVSGTQHRQLRPERTTCNSVLRRGRRHPGSDNGEPSWPLSPRPYVSSICLLVV
jgi:hypothetical protein